MAALHTWFRAPFRRRLVVALLVVPTLALSTGCANDAAPKRIGAFAQATTETTDNVKEAFDVVNSVYVQTRTEEALKAIAAGGAVDPKVVVRPLLDPAQLQVRLDVLESVSTYATLLSELLGNEPQARLDAAFDGLSDSLRNLAKNDSLERAFSKPDVNGTFRPVLNDQEVGLLSTALNELARAVIDAKRQREAKRLIVESDERVGAICQLLQRDIGLARNTPGLRSQLYASYDKQLTDRFGWISRFSPRPGNAPGADAGAVLSPIEQRSEVQAWLDIANKQAVADATMSATYVSIGKVAKAHEQLVRAFDPSAPELEQLIRSLKAEADRVRDRYRRLSTGK